MNTGTTTRHTWEFGTDELPRLRLQADHADIFVRHAAGPGQTSITLTAEAAVDLAEVQARSEGREISVVIPALRASEGSGFGFSFQLGGFTIGAGNSVRLRLDVLLPEGADLDLKVGGGDIVIDGRSGELRARTGGGDVRFDDAGDAVVHTGGGDIRAVRTGQGNLDTGGGDISIDSLGEGRLHSGGGDVHVGAIASGAVKTGGGDIYVGRTEGDVSVSTGGGDVRMDSCRGATEVITGAGDVSAHVVSGRWQARTGAGDIIVSVPPGIPVWQDLSSPLGDVSSRLGGRGEPAEGQDHIEIIARTGTGDISLS
ncbi:MAG: hypothetical protein QM582_03390 [Micropruina sp.]|uniref:DUF4097 family beta strand repeat-containing protein n=1 Tax=Micropruina sp. TaxID=2737536 RepID=UPI0039E40C3B